MNDSLKISIITPSFNQGKFIESNIISVLSQNYPNFEHIIIDGKSSDETVSILQKYKHLKWISEIDKGQTEALNKAMEYVTGDIIGWLNSDDVYCKNAFKTVNEYFIKNSNIDALTGNLIYTDNNLNIIKLLQSEQLTYNGLLNYGQCVIQPSTFFKRKVFDEVGKFNESYNYCMDHEFFLRVLKKFDITPIGDDIAMFRYYDNSKSGSSELEFIKELLKIKKNYNGKIFTRYNAKLILMFIKYFIKKYLYSKNYFD